MDADLGRAEQVLAKAAVEGIDLRQITADLERQGVQTFCDSYHELLDCIESKLGVVAAT